MSGTTTTHFSEEVKEVRLVTDIHLSEEEVRLDTEAQKTWQALLKAEQADDVGNMMIVLARLHHYLEILSSTKRSTSHQKEWERAIEENLKRLDITLDDYRRVFRKQHLGYAKQHLEELRSVRPTRLAILRVKRWVKEAGVKLEDIGTTQHELDGYLKSIEKAEGKPDVYIPLSNISLPATTPTQSASPGIIPGEEPELKVGAQLADTVVQRYAPMMPEETEEDEFETRATEVFRRD